MTPLRWIVVIGFVGLFVFAKVWVLRHPRGLAALIVGAALLIISEPAQAQ
jgi:ABC-type cobalamin transport system permease subunit